MSWRRADSLCAKFKKLFNKNLKPNERVVSGTKTLIVSGQVFWEDGRARPSRPAHSHRLLQFEPTRTAPLPLIMLRGNQGGNIDVLVTTKTSDIIHLANSQQLSAIRPEAEVSNMGYGCIMKKLELEGVAFAAQVVAKAANQGLLNYENFKL